VIVKPSHGRRILAGARSGGSPSGDVPSGELPSSGFSSKAAYIFRKQLEEADFLIINRVDALERAEIDDLANLLQKEYPTLPQLRISAKTGEGFDALLQMLDQRGGFGRRVLDLDYDIYAEGEAELGWLNSNLVVASPAGVKFPLDSLLLEIVRRLKSALAAQGAETAHLKTIGLWEGFYGVANLVSGDATPELSLPSGCETPQAEVVVNARVAVDPDTLTRLVTHTVDGVCGSMGLVARWRETRSFRPGRPVPTHRLAAPRS
jgi:glutaredoxin-related protein